MFKRWNISLKKKHFSFEANIVGSIKDGKNFLNKSCTVSRVLQCCEETKLKKNFFKLTIVKQKKN